MKKLLMTIGAAFTMSIAVWAQDTTQQSNQYRTEPMMDQAEERLDTAANEINNEFREQGQNIREGVDTTTTNFQEHTEQAGDTLMQELEQAGNEVQDNSGLNQDMQQNPENTDNSMNQNADQSSAQPSSENESADQNDINQDDGNQQTAAADIEVVEDKEGPNHEVVYKYQGELYMVDREEQKLKKVESSELRDTEHEVMIHEGTATDNNQQGSGRRTRG